MRRAKIVSGTSHPELTGIITRRLGCNAAPVSLKRFSNQETSVEIGFERWFRRKGGGSPAILSLFKAIQNEDPQRRYYSQNGICHVITMDLHASQMQGFFKFPIDNLTAEPSIARWIRENVDDYSSAVAVSKNAGGAKRATSLADRLGLSFALIHTDRQRGTSVFNDTTGSISERSARSDVDGSEGPEPNDSVGINEPTMFRSQSPAGLSQSNTEGRYSRNGPSPSKNRTRQDIRTGRLKSGHIVDDGYPHSSAASVVSESNGVSSRPFDPMSSSFLSAATDNAVGVSENAHALGGTIDTAVPSDDEEENMMLSLSAERLITLVGDVYDRTAIIIDDIIETPTSYIAAAEHLMKNCGAKEVICVATHGVFQDCTLEYLEQCDCIHRIVVTNSYPIPRDKLLSATKLTVIDIGPVFAEAIRRTQNGESLLDLYANMA